MPLISHFHGIRIYMYFDDESQHHLPHFHAKYAGKEAVFDMNGNCLAGDLPTKQTRLILAWVELRRDELDALWATISDDHDYFKIEGL